MTIELTQEQANNLLVLINRAQIQGVESEVVSELKQIIKISIQRPTVAVKVAEGKTS